MTYDTVIGNLRPDPVFEKEARAVSLNELRAQQNNGLCFVLFARSDPRNAVRYAPSRSFGARSRYSLEFCSRPSGRHYDDHFSRRGRPDERPSLSFGPRAGHDQ